MENEVNIQMGAVLCPMCQFGMIKKYVPSSNAYVSTDHLENYAFMTCPYCGEKCLVGEHGTRIAYDFRNDDCQMTELVILDE